MNTRAAATMRARIPKRLAWISPAPRNPRAIRMTATTVTNNVRWKRSRTSAITPMRMKRPSTVGSLTKLKNLLNTGSGKSVNGTADRPTFARNPGKVSTRPVIKPVALASAAE